MSHIKLDISAIQHEMVSVGNSVNAVAARIGQLAKERSISARELHRMCVRRYEGGFIDYVPAYLTIANFLAQKGAATPYDVVAAIIDAMGYDIVAMRTMVHADAIKVVEDGSPAFTVPPTYKRSDDFLAKHRYDTSKLKPKRKKQLV